MRWLREMREKLRYSVRMWRIGAADPQCSLILPPGVEDGGDRVRGVCASVPLDRQPVHQSVSRQAHVAVGRHGKPSPPVRLGR